MYEYLQDNITDTCQDIKLALYSFQKARGDKRFHSTNQSLINLKPIEKISHHIWLSRLDENGKGKEISDNDFDSLSAQISRMNHDNSNFKHIVWVNG